MKKPGQGKRNELLALLQKRWDMFIKDLPDIYQKPPVLPTLKEETATITQKAIAEYTLWHNTDPFAKDRITLYIERGLENPFNVYKDYHARNLAREVARRNMLQEQEQSYA